MEKEKISSEMMVSVFCIAYNHERYISQCLESLVNQETEYRYEILVHDDASTDNTAEIIRSYQEKYPHLIKTVYQKENQFSKGKRIVSNFLFPLAEGKYFASCEGDDFWTDPHKLQKQIKYMEEHPECVMSGHGAYYANEDGSLVSGEFFCRFDSDKVLEIEELIQKWCFATNTRMYRSEFFPPEGVPYQGDCNNGDQALTIWYGLHGEVHYLSEKMAAYRRVSVGSLTWLARNDKERRKTLNEKYIAMMRRIDEYTEGKYSATIEEFIKDMEFKMYLMFGDIKKLKLYESRWEKTGLMTKARVSIKYYLPWIKSCIQKIRRLQNKA